MVVESSALEPLDDESPQGSNSQPPVVVSDSTGVIVVEELVGPAVVDGELVEEDGDEVVVTVVDAVVDDVLGEPLAAVSAPDVATSGSTQRSARPSPDADP